MGHSLESLFNIKGKVAVVTGGGGILCGEMARALGDLGVKVAVLSRHQEKADATVKEITDAGGTAIGVSCDATSIEDNRKAYEVVKKEFGEPDFLINGAGGNSKNATTGGVSIADGISPTFFELDAEAMKFVVDLNLLGTVLTTQVFAKPMVARKSGSIINISSLSGILPLTKVMGYSAAKAAIENFTRWLSVHMADANIRVNAIAPGFFLTEQNRFLLTDEKTGELTARGQLINTATPMNRFGKPEELVSAMVYLLSDSASFVTGTTMIVDGGYAAFSGV
jgi:NAD(P)-dependent dehydrogenase (short-subunit alcohol dehydrogenase family)